MISWKLLTKYPPFSTISRTAKFLKCPRKYTLSPWNSEWRCVSTDILSVGTRCISDKTTVVTLLSPIEKANAYFTIFSTVGRCSDLCVSANRFSHAFFTFVQVSYMCLRSLLLLLLDHYISTSHVYFSCCVFYAIIPAAKCSIRRFSVNLWLTKPFLASTTTGPLHPRNGYSCSSLGLWLNISQLNLCITFLFFREP